MEALTLDPLSQTEIKKLNGTSYRSVFEMIYERSRRKQGREEVVDSVRVDDNNFSKAMPKEICQQKQNVEQSNCAESLISEASNEKENARACYSNGEVKEEKTELYSDSLPVQSFPNSMYTFQQTSSANHELDLHSTSCKKQFNTNNLFTKVSVDISPIKTSLRKKERRVINVLHISKNGEEYSCIKKTTNLDELQEQNIEREVLATNNSQIDLDLINNNNHEQCEIEQSSICLSDKTNNSDCIIRKEQEQSESNCFEIKNKHQDICVPSSKQSSEECIPHVTTCSLLNSNYRHKDCFENKYFLENSKNRNTRPLSRSHLENEKLSPRSQFQETHRSSRSQFVKMQLWSNSSKYYSQRSTRRGQNFESAQLRKAQKQIRYLLRSCYASNEAFQYCLNFLTYTLQSHGYSEEMIAYLRYRFKNFQFLLTEKLGNRPKDTKCSFENDTKLYTNQEFYKGLYQNESKMLYLLDGMLHPSSQRTNKSDGTYIGMRHGVSHSFHVTEDAVYPKQHHQWIHRDFRVPQENNHKCSDNSSECEAGPPNYFSKKRLDRQDMKRLNKFSYNNFSKPQNSFTNKMPLSFRTQCNSDAYNVHCKSPYIVSSVASCSSEISLSPSNLSPVCFSPTQNQETEDVVQLECDNSPESLTCSSPVYDSPLKYTEKRERLISPSCRQFFAQILSENSAQCIKIRSNNVSPLNSQRSHSTNSVSSKSPNTSEVKSDKLNSQESMQFFKDSEEDLFSQHSSGEYHISLDESSETPECKRINIPLLGLEGVGTGAWLSGEKTSAAHISPRIECEFSEHIAYLAKKQ